jgi:hypothetical protein
MKRFSAGQLLAVVFGVTLAVSVYSRDRNLLLADVVSWV